MHIQRTKCQTSVTPPDDLYTPLKYFIKLIKVLELLKEQTNVYCVQKSEHHSNVNTTVKEPEILIGLYLRLCQMPGNRARWENDTRGPMVLNKLSHNL